MRNLKILAPYIALIAAIILQYYVAYSNPVVQTNSTDVYNSVESGLDG